MGDWDVEAETSPAAIEWLRSKVPMTEREFESLSLEAQRRAFKVAGLTELDDVSEVWRAIDSAIEDGTTLEDFRQDVGHLFESEAMLETVFRTNVQSAYSAGRYRQNMAARATHPYLRFSAIIDGHETDICHGLDGTVLPSDDPFWTSHQPPLHFNCRSDVTAITEEEAREIGIDNAQDVADAPEADDGFGGVLDDFEPDLSTRPPDLAAIYEAKKGL